MIESPQEYLDFSKVPESQGLPKSLFAVGFVGLICIFIIGGLTVGMAGFGHVWPAPQSMRVNLGQLPK